MKALGTIDNFAHKISVVVPEWLIPLMGRIAVFLIFWKSAQTKISGLTIWGQDLAFWNITNATLSTFQYKYAIPHLPPTIAAYMATFGEFFFSIGILLGILTRFSALGLLIVTAVIQIFVHPEFWSIHILWTAILLYLLKNGPGPLSLDRVLHGNTQHSV